ncbi:4-hydroxybenzoate octaprenyltransferase [Terrihabitans rhizophilus]|uniref:4-hydroxybenzoate octaprenyltransferase n=1 Tax=Terrihabitans rhizophilus TaxID=3092662 RepID=A0ABU4RPZ0_9HYPH|nr:4-hydroxybenzoate octaprenyltransferase [Terrihabitans sp. PJ23]MDX6806894.1 4-hydroxybenzoate octaprenyltransferase [Terrihabitans sp. PJ23]
MSNAAPHVADAAPGNWVDRHAPRWLKPFARLARWDRPIGAWLLFWPCAWGAALAAISAGHGRDELAGDTWHILLFFVGSVAMRGAGCTWNDIVDRKIDARVARTASRPIPSGQIGVRGALAFLAVQLAAGLLVLLQFNAFTIVLGFASVIPVISYPFMKRITFWPQINLGVCFGWGALVAWSAVFGGLQAAPVLLYVGTICWIIGYDTVYALQDIEDDVLAGVGSTAIRFGEDVKSWLTGFYAAAVLLIGLALGAAGAGVVAFIGLAAFAAHLGWQVWRLRRDDARLCLRLFKANNHAGLILFAGLAVEIVLRGMS